MFFFAASVGERAFNFPCIGLPIYQYRDGLVVCDAKVSRHISVRTISSKDRDLYYRCFKNEIVVNDLSTSWNRTDIELASDFEMHMDLVKQNSPAAALVILYRGNEVAVMVTDDGFKQYPVVGGEYSLPPGVGRLIYGSSFREDMPSGIMGDALHWLTDIWGPTVQVIGRELESFRYRGEPLNEFWSRAFFGKPSCYLLMGGGFNPCMKYGNVEMRQLPSRNSTVKCAVGLPVEEDRGYYTHWHLEITHALSAVFPVKESSSDEEVLDNNSNKSNESSSREVSTARNETVSPPVDTRPDSGESYIPIGRAETVSPPPANEVKDSNRAEAISPPLQASKRRFKLKAGGLYRRMRSNAAPMTTTTLPAANRTADDLSIRNKTHKIHCLCQ